jgi:ribosomal protein S18 acetylase RimI-like enzyme
MTVAPVVRQARHDELDAVGRLTVDAFVEDHLVPRDHFYADYLADAASRGAHGEVLVAVAQDGALLGAVTVARPGTPLGDGILPGELTFRALAVDPTARRRGAGQALVRAVISRARDLGVDRIVIFSGQVMTSAHALYAALGFVRLPARDTRVEDEDVYAFALDLGRR